ncbi:hypothetical protein C4553_03840 [Candidatus Parcubacteria bacterium]|nr:MAG: hypothetical protein C4553_03840 [Candidatus Parcubacteria bacterium]
MFGSDAQFRVLFSEKAKGVGLAIAEELGITTEEAKRLPDEQKLGPKSSEAFTSFREWFETNQ